MTGDARPARPARALVDHVVCLVPDLAAARERAREEGFTVSPGGTHAGGLTRNALIGLPDGAYIELLEFTVPGVGVVAGALGRVGLLGAVLRWRTPLDRRFVPRARWGPGVIDFAVSVEAGVAGVSPGVIPGEGPVRGRRVRPDGETLEWEMFFPREPALPFFLRDVTDRTLRVPGGEAAHHANGAVGIARVVVSADDPAGASAVLAGATDGAIGVDGVGIGDAAVAFRPRSADEAYQVWLRCEGDTDIPLPLFTWRTGRSEIV